MATKEEATSGGVGLTGLVFIVFLILKLGGWGVVATWSWWWVTSPLWIPLLVAIAVIVICLLFAGIASSL